MKLNGKTYHWIKTKNYFKTNNFFLFVTGINQNSSDWLVTEQKLKTIGFNHYKLLNRAAVKAIKSSIYFNNSSVITGLTLSLKPQTNMRFFKYVVLNTFNLLSFELLVIKFNNKMYSINSLKNVYSLKYKETKLLFYQFSITYLKNCYKFSK